MTPVDGAVTPPRPHVTTRSSSTGRLQGAAHLEHPLFSTSQPHAATKRQHRDLCSADGGTRHTASRDTATGLRSV